MGCHGTVGDQDGNEGIVCVPCLGGTIPMLGISARRRKTTSGLRVFLTMRQKWSKMTPKVDIWPDITGTVVAQRDVIVLILCWYVALVCLLTLQAAGYPDLILAWVKAESSWLRWRYVVKLRVGSGRTIGKSSRLSPRQEDWTSYEKSHPRLPEKQSGTCKDPMKDVCISRRIIEPCFDTHAKHARHGKIPVGP